MHPGLLKSIHEKLADSAGELLSWGHWRLDKLSAIPEWRYRVIVDLVVRFSIRYASNLHKFLGLGILLIYYLIS